MIQSQHLPMESALRSLQSETSGFNLGDGQCSEECPLSKQNKRSTCTPSSNNLATLAKKIHTCTHSKKHTYIKKKFPDHLWRWSSGQTGGQLSCWKCWIYTFMSQSEKTCSSLLLLRCSERHPSRWCENSPLWFPFQLAPEPQLYHHPALTSLSPLQFPVLKWPQTLTLPLGHRSITILLIYNH